MFLGDNTVKKLRDSEDIPLMLVCPSIALYNVNCPHDYAVYMGISNPCIPSAFRYLQVKNTLAPVHVSSLSPSPSIYIYIYIHIYIIYIYTHVYI